MANLRQAIAASESVRMKFLTGKPFTEEDVRMELSPSTDLRKDYDEAMRLVHDLVGHIEQLRKERDLYFRLYYGIWPTGVKS